MAWKPRLPAKSVEQALAAVLADVPTGDVPARPLETDEDVVQMADEMRKADPNIDRRDRLNIVRQRARIMRVDDAKKRRT